MMCMDLVWYPLGLAVWRPVCPPPMLRARIRGRKAQASHDCLEVCAQLERPDARVHCEKERQGQVNVERNIMGWQQ